jgi:hypothetical protein
MDYVVQEYFEFRACGMTPARAWSAAMVMASFRYGERR